MKIFNTYSGQKEQINLSEKVGIYVCGITPYDTTHIGHAFLFVVYDAFIRYLRFLDTKVIYVQNVTDIDDDILIKSHSLNINWIKLGESQTKNHLKNMDALGVLRPDFYPKATENIKEMIKIVQRLVELKVAYEKNGSVYYDVKKDQNFGMLSKYGYPAMLEIANERGNFPLDPNKKDPLDFVLWQKKKTDEPYWDSPWGKGRPGWHIECTTMSLRHLGPTITIHGGGSDLIFPHHEAEIVQSERLTGKKFVKVWMHAAMVYHEGKKMSKSLGNMVFVSDLLNKYDKNTIRIFLLMHNWNTPWNYEEKELVKARKISQIFRTYVKGKPKSLNKSLNEAKSFFDYLDDNFRTDYALAFLSRATITKKISKETLNQCLNSLGLIY